MTKREVIEMLTAKAECIRREASGTDIDCNLRNCDECDLCYKQGTTGDQMEALRVAISALQAQDLQPTCNQLETDTIYRQVAIDALMKILDRPNHAEFLYTDEICKTLNDLPSAQPEPTTEIQEILNYLDTTLHPIVSPDNWYAYAELYDMVSSLPTAQHWISCSERLPEEDEQVFVYLFDDSPYIAWVCEGRWHTEEFMLDKDEEPVAWMPLPAQYE